MHPTPSPVRGRPGWRLAVMLAAVVLLAHGLLVDAIAPTRPTTRPSEAKPLQVRVLPETARLEPLAAAGPPSRATRVVPLAPLAPLASVPVPSVARASEWVPVAMVEAVAPAMSLTAPTGAAAIAQPATQRSEPQAEVPVYRTRLPPPMMLRFELKRGMLAGIGALLWRPVGRQYELRLDGQVAGLPVLTQASRGAIDAAGIAPDRFTDQRLRRGVQAANFQRDKRLVTFSSSSAEYPLVEGAQDRLSWMMQLAGVVAAEPARARANGKVALFVVGTRGEADTWVFDYSATENVATAQGPVRALKFTREPRRPYDSKVEIWLDPARHHVPVHARFTDGETLDLLLVGTEPA